MCVISSGLTLTFLKEGTRKHILQRAGYPSPIHHGRGLTWRLGAAARPHGTSLPKWYGSCARFYIHESRPAVTSGPVE